MIIFKNLKAKVSLIVVFSIAILILFYTAYLTRDNTQQPIAQNGVLDLTSWDLSKDGPIELKGNWEFYWDQLLTYEDFSENNAAIHFDGYQNVPKVWNKYTMDTSKPTEMGYGTYRLKVKLNETQKDLALKILTMSTAYNLMINDRLVASSGIVGTTKQTSKPQYKPQSINIYEASNEFDVIVQVSNYTYSRGGMWHSITLGHDQDIRNMSEIIQRRETFILGVMIIMLCYYFCLYWIQRRNKSMLYAMLGLLVMSVRILVTGQYYITSIFPSIPFSWIIFLEYNTIYWGPIAWVLFIGELFPDEFSKKLLRVLTYNAIVLSVLTYILPVHIYTRFLLIIEVYSIILFIYSLVSVILAAKHNKSEAKILLFCVSLIFIAFVIEVLFFWNAIANITGGGLMIAVSITVLVQAYIIAARYSRAFDEAEKYSHKIEYLNKLKDDFLANTSHELRTPLNGIISITEATLNDHNNEFSEDIRNNLNMVVQMGERLSFLIRDLLDFSMMKHDKLMLEKNTFNLVDLIDQLLLEIQWKAKSKKIVITHDKPMQQVIVTADKYRVIQVLYNLVGNAVKYTGEHGQITVRVNQSVKNISISVIDNGVGIREEQLNSIFEPFERGDMAENDYNGGLGLGLNISKAIAHAHGGDILVESKVGQGSKFTLVLPSISQDHSTFMQQEETLVYPAESAVCSEDRIVLDGKDKTCIVVIDDQYSNIVGLSSILNAQGYNVKGFTDPEEGLNEILLHRQTDIAIVDLMMPKLSGYQICQKIREQFSLFELPILILTARTHGDTTIKSLEVGANDVLHKPFDRQELLARVNTLKYLKALTQQAIFNEVARLQAQINPHFLHNALNALAACCYQDAEKACDAIVSLSNYLRYSYDLSPEVKEIPLSKELELVKAYLAVEKVRFGDKVAYELNFTDSENVKLPPFLIQPLVENAVRHGITKKADGGYLKIYGYRNINNYVIGVEDDGIGISKQILSCILSGEKPDGCGIGLSNVRQRLKKRYNADLHIESSYAKGTKIYFEIAVFMEV